MIATDKKIRSYKDLKIWSKGMQITKAVYQATQNFPEEEKFGLSSQMKRCSDSIPSNIAEGWGRDSTRNYSQFVKIARGSLMELETQIILSNELGFIEKETFKISPS